MQFTLSKERRTEAENVLITDAIDAFRARAAVVQRSLRADGYRIIELNINTESPIVRPMSMAMRAEGPSAPQFESGTTDITVTVTGSIELLPAN
jgi:predicted secreted protein